VTVNGTTDGEGSLVLIFWVHLDLIVPRVGIHEAEKFVVRCCVDHLVYARQWEAIIGIGFIQIDEVDADSPLSVFLFHQDGLASQSDKVSLR